MSQVISRSMYLLDRWKPFSAGKKAVNVYGLSVFGKYLVSNTGMGYKTETFDEIDPMMVPFIDFLERDEANKHFFGEIGSELTATPKKAFKLLKEGGAYAKVLDIHEKPYPGRNVMECGKLWVEWDSFPRKLGKRRMPCPLIEKTPVQELSPPSYLWRKKRPTTILFLTLTLPLRYDYRIESVNRVGEINVRYRHPIWGRLRSEVYKPVLRGISKGEISEDEVIDKVGFTLEGKKRDLAYIFHTGLEYMEMIRKAPTIKEKLKIRGFSSMADYLVSVYGRHSAY